MFQRKTAVENVWGHSLNVVMAMHQLEDESEDFDLLAIYCLNHNPAPPIKVNIEVNGFVVPMKVDTGALTSLLIIGIPCKRSILVHSLFCCQQNAGNKLGKLFCPNQ